jgi:hypothetical protein
MALSIKQINQFQLKHLRMAGFLEFVQQVLNIVKTYRDSGEAGVSQLPAKAEVMTMAEVRQVLKVTSTKDSENNNPRRLGGEYCFTLYSLSEFS